MWFFKRKPKKVEEEEPEEDSAEEAPEEGGGDSAAAAQIDKIQAELTKINGNVDSLKESRKMTQERFSTMNEQIGELRGQVNDAQRSVGMIEVKATKATDLVESVHPDKLMIQIQKSDGKIEGLRGMLEAKEEMMKNIMDQMKKLRDQMALFRGIEQVLKLNEEVKGELMTIKKISATVERHADRVDNVFVEAQKSFEAFNTFSDKLDTIKSDIKELQQKVDKTDAAIQASVKKKDFDDKIAKIERHDKKVKGMIEELEKLKSSISKQFTKLETQVRADFDYRLKKAEIISSAFDDLLVKNPLFADGLKLDKYLKDHIGAGAT
jgi:chromosome segregation ATPase